MKEARNWIIGSGLVVFLAFGTKAIITNTDIPSGIQALLVLVLTTGLGAETIGKAIEKRGKNDDDSGSDK